MNSNRLYLSLKLWVLLTIILFSILCVLRIRHIGNRLPGSQAPNIDSNNKTVNNSNDFRNNEAEAEKRIEHCVASTDFQREMEDLLARRGVWKEPCRGNKMQDFFRAWFSVDAIGALKGVGMLPESQEGFLDCEAMRRDALLCSAVAQHDQHPVEFIHAADKLLSPGSAEHLKSQVVLAVGANNIDVGISLLKSEFGQGAHKNDAVDLLFAHWSVKNFKVAILAARNLDFDEDRKTAHRAIGRSAKYQTNELILWAEQQGMPHDLVVNALSSSAEMERSGKREKASIDNFENIVNSHERDRARWIAISNQLRESRR